MPVGKKCPLKAVALAVDEKEKAIESSWGRAQSWWRPLRVWEAMVECRWHGKVEGNQMNQQNENKWTTTKWTKISPKQVPSLGVFDYFMVIDDYL